MTCRPLGRSYSMNRIGLRIDFRSGTPAVCFAGVAAFVVDDAGDSFADESTAETETRKRTRKDDLKIVMVRGDRGGVCLVRVRRASDAQIGRRTPEIWGV